MNEETFEAAVEVARDIIRDTEETFAEFGASTPELLARLYRDQPAEIQERNLHRLIWCSEEIVAAWDAVSRIAQDLLREEGSLPPELAEWTADVLDDVLAGRRPRPTKRGPDPDANLARDRAIVDAVQWLNQSGLKAMRNAIRNKDRLPTKACFEGGSACDAVGVAACMGYKNVERVWTKSAAPDSPIRRRKHVVVGFTNDSPPRAVVSYENRGEK